jgi:hypothetical protein
MLRKAKQSAARRAADEQRAAPAVRSRLRPFVQAHVVLGLLATAAVAAHAGPRLPAGIAGALALAFWATALSGMVGGLAYRFVPRRLSELERRGALPEDLRAERETLFDRLYRAASGKSELVKKITERVLLPYARAAFGPVVLALGGRTLRAEEQALRGRIEQLLEGRGGEKLTGIEELVRIVVELRALPARRWLTALLRAWLPLHVVLTAALLLLLVLHVISTVRW